MLLDLNIAFLLIFRAITMLANASLAESSLMTHPGAKHRTASKRLPELDTIVVES